MKIFAVRGEKASEAKDLAYLLRKKQAALY